jgi:methionyl-tRNA formyltransferase
MRVTFLGNAAWSVPSLEALGSSPHEIAVVLTRTPRPAGRGGRLRSTPVADAARRLELPLIEIDTVKSGSGLEALKGSAPDVLVVVAYGEIVPAGVLAVPAVAPVNVHFSLLPELRGAAPVQRAILEGMPVTGVTTIRMDEGMDTGPILLQATEAIDEQDDAGSLGARLAGIGGRLLVDTLDRLAAGELEERAQEEAAATYAPKLTPAEEGLDWTKPAESIVRQVRALAPEPGATASFRGRPLKVFRARTTDAEVAADGPAGGPGSVALATKDGLVVWAGEGSVALEEVQPAGKRRMSGGEFVRGYRPETAEALA